MNLEKAHLPDNFTIHDNTGSDKQDIANSFNDYFVNLDPCLAAKFCSATPPNDFLDGPNPSSLFFFQQQR